MSRSMAVVVPVRDGAALLGPCLTGLREEAGAEGADLVVVDDGSTDDTAAAAAALGARVLPGSGTGPYAARNLGWRATDAAVVVFTDVRCRPRPGWLHALATALGDDDVAIAGGDVFVLDGPTPAQRYLHRLQPYLTAPYLAHPFLPYVPTCNLATRRSVLEAVGGFQETRSGSDARFCWTALLQGLGSVVSVAGAEMDMVGRSRARGVLRQWWRYGQENPLLAREFADRGHPPPNRSPLSRAVAGGGWRMLRALRHPIAADWPVEALGAATTIAHAAATGRSTRRARKQAR